MFGRVREEPQNESTPFHPRSPYGVAKAYGHWITLTYRETHDLFAVSGILYNHESPRRGTEFVTRKISDGVARIKCGLADSFLLGNLDAARDWGYAGDYVRAMWMMLNAEQPADYVIGTGVTHTVREFCQIAFARVGLDYTDYVNVDPKLYRPAEAYQLRADPTKARGGLGWEPAVGFAELVETMVDADVGDSPDISCGADETDRRRHRGPGAWRWPLHLRDGAHQGVDRDFPDDHLAVVAGDPEGRASCGPSQPT